MVPAQLLSPGWGMRAAGALKSGLARASRRYARGRRQEQHLLHLPLLGYQAA
jgi:hypothetical protein